MWHVVEWTFLAGRRGQVVAGNTRVGLDACRRGECRTVRASDDDDDTSDEYVEVDVGGVEGCLPLIGDRRQPVTEVDGVGDGDAGERQAPGFTLAGEAGQLERQHIVFGQLVLSDGLEGLLDLACVAAAVLEFTAVAAIEDDAAACRCFDMAAGKEGISVNRGDTGIDSYAVSCRCVVGVRTNRSGEDHRSTFGRERRVHGRRCGAADLLTVNTEGDDLPVPAINRCVVRRCRDDHGLLRLRIVVGRVHRSEHNHPGFAVDRRSGEGQRCLLGRRRYLDFELLTEVDVGVEHQVGVEGFGAFWGDGNGDEVIRDLGQRYVVGVVDRAVVFVAIELLVRIEGELELVVSECVGDQVTARRLATGIEDVGLGFCVVSDDRCVFALGLARREGKRLSDQVEFRLVRFVARQRDNQIVELTIDETANVRIRVGPRERDLGELEVEPRRIQCEADEDCEWVWQASRCLGIDHGADSNHVGAGGSELITLQWRVWLAQVVDAEVRQGQLGR